MGTSTKCSDGETARVIMSITPHPATMPVAAERDRTSWRLTDLGAFAFPFVSTGAAVVPAASSSAGKANGRKPAGRQRRHSVHHGCLVLSV